MATKILDDNYCSFSDFQTVQNVILFCPSCYKASQRTIYSCGLFLDAVDVSEVFQILVRVVLFYHKGLDLFSEFFLHLGILNDVVYHSIKIVRSSVSACNEKRTELFENLLVRVKIFDFR